MWKQTSHSPAVQPLGDTKIIFCFGLSLAFTLETVLTGRTLTLPMPDWVGEAVGLRDVLIAVLEFCSEISCVCVQVQGCTVEAIKGLQFLGFDMRRQDGAVVMAIDV